MIDYESHIEGLSIHRSVDGLVIERPGRSGKSTALRALKFAFFGFIIVAAAFVIILVGAAAISLLVGGRFNPQTFARRAVSMPWPMLILMMKLASIFGSLGAVGGYVWAMEGRRGWRVALNGSALFLMGSAQHPKELTPDVFTDATAVGRRVIVEFKNPSGGNWRLAPTITLSCPTQKAARQVVELIKAWRRNA